MDMQALQAALGHRFQNPSLLETALTHRSADPQHNERLEFLGDSILNCVVADLLYAAHPGSDEGELSRLRAGLVRQEALHEVALQLDLGRFLRLGEGELRSGGHRRPSILADALEAILGAIYLDGGFSAAHAVVSRLWLIRVGKTGATAALKDPKTRLQEALQAKRLPLPEYVLEAVSGAAHAQTFRVACRLARSGIETAGEGHSRRAAEQVAAEQAYTLLVKAP